MRQFSAGYATSRPRCGCIHLGRRKINLSSVFTGQTIGISEVDEQIRLFSFLEYDLAYFDNEWDRVESGPSPCMPVRRPIIFFNIPLSIVRVWILQRPVESAPNSGHSKACFDANTAGCIRPLAVIGKRQVVKETNLVIFQFPYQHFRFSLPKKNGIASHVERTLACRNHDFGHW